MASPITNVDQAMMAFILIILLSTNPNPLAIGIDTSKLKQVLITQVKSYLETTFGINLDLVREGISKED